MALWGVAAGVAGQGVTATFEVDLRAETAAGRFDPARDRVELRGGFPPLSWQQGQPLRPHGVGRWSVPVDFARRPAGGQAVPHKFRIVREGQGPQDGWEPGANRLASLDGPTPVVARVFGAPTEPARTVHTGTVLTLEPLPAGHPKARPVWVWLPPGYEREPARRYPVLYLHDGQNMFDARVAGAEWQIDEVAQRGVLDGTLEPFIAVAVPSGRERIHELTPTPGGRGGGGLAAYGEWLLDALKPEIDRRFRTRPEPAHTAVGGSSLGGIASLWLALHRADRVGAALVVSPSMWWDGFQPRRDVLAATPPVLRPRIWLDVGAHEGEGVFTESRALRDALRQRGWGGDRLAYVEDPEGRHDELSWAGRVEGMLGFLFPPAPADARIDALVAPWVDNRRFSGAVVLMRDGRVVHAAGYGIANHEAGLPFTPDTPTDGASMAKTFTAAGLWALAHEGRVSIDDPVRRWVPEYPHVGVTLRQVLAHSHGLTTGYEAFDRFFRPGEPRTTARLLTLSRALAPKPAFAPGTRFAYGDLPFDAVGRAIEQASGQDYVQFVRERFFAPLGLAHAFARPPRLADWPQPRTRGYRFEQGRWQDHDAYDDEAFLGASNLVFSARDLAHWGDAWASGRVLPPPAERAALAPQRIGAGHSRLNGLGWYCADDALRCHFTGHYNGFHTLVHWDRERRETVALVSNSGLAGWEGLTLQRALVNTLAGRPVEAPSMLPSDVVRIDPARRTRLSGAWTVPGFGTLGVKGGRAGLVLRLPDGLVLDAQPVSPELFHVPGTDWLLAFGDGGRRLLLLGMHHRGEGRPQNLTDSRP